MNPTTIQLQQRAKIQDAYHYALAAAGDDNSTFVGRDAEFSRSTYLKMAVRAAREAGLIGRGCMFRSLPSRRLSDAPTIVTAIREAADWFGVDPFTGEAIRGEESK